MISTLCFLCFAACFLPAIGYFEGDQIAEQWYASLSLLLLFILYVLFKLMHNTCSKEQIIQAICRASAVILNTECVYSLWKGYPFHNAIHGTCDNPTGLALNICMLLPFLCKSLVYDKDKSYFCLITLLMAFVTIILTHCRAAFICLLLLLVINVLFGPMKRWVKVSIFVCAIVAGATLCVGYKNKSNMGRQLILHNSLELIKAEPLVGYGKNGFCRVYMSKQAEYFKKNPNSQYGLLADEVQHPLNEFVSVWIKYGIIGVSVLLGLLLFPFIQSLRNRNLLQLCILCVIMVFALTSYPFSYPMPCFLLTGINVINLYKIADKQLKRIWGQYKRFIFSFTLLIISICVCCFMMKFGFDYRWNRAAYIGERGHRREALREFKSLKSHYENNPYFLYNYMYELVCVGDMHNATQIHRLLSNLMSSYNLELLAGDTYRYKQQYAEALQHYETAMWMCPVRFAPLEGMMQTYRDSGDLLRADSIAQIILAKPVKVPSPQVEEIKRKAREGMSSKMTM